MNGGALDSHRSFAGALDGIGAGGDPLDGFVVHSRFVRADAPIGEGEGGGLVPPGVTLDPEQFRAINGGNGAAGAATGRGGRENRRPPGMDPTRADHVRAKQANLIGRSDSKVAGGGGGGGGGAGTRRGGKATAKKPAWGGGGGGTKGGKAKPHRWV